MMQRRLARAEVPLLPYSATPRNQGAGQDRTGLWERGLPIIQGGRA